jgi:hypothetical protein
MPAASSYEELTAMQVESIGSDVKPIQSVLTKPIRAKLQSELTKPVRVERVGSGAHLTT